MLFNSLHFFLFAPPAIAGYFLLPDRFRKPWLLLSSFYFYAVFKLPFVLVLLVSVFATHYSVILMSQAKKKRSKFVFLLLALAANLSILYFNKYIDFSIDILNLSLGLSPCKPDAFQPWGAILPMGISFFTLQAMAYAVDVYRGVIAPTRSVFHFGLFLSFFPQLVAGPIMRAKDLLHQFKEHHVFTMENFQAGLRLIALGLFKKTIVADTIASTVDSVYAAPQNHSGASLAGATFLFVVQIYCDFSGYSDIAIGTGRIMGFRIPLNFNRPLLAGSVTELWRRWHISLSTWLRDYVYIPLGGSRVGALRTYINVIAAMAVAGIWHGADWTFLVWGLINAMASIGERFLFSFPRGKKFYESLPRVVRTLYTVVLFCTAAVFFRAQPVADVPGLERGIQSGLLILERIFSMAPGMMLEISPGAAFAVLILFLMEFAEERNPGFGRRMLADPLRTYAIAGTVMLVCLFIYAVTISPRFLYFQF